MISEEIEDRETMIKIFNREIKAFSKVEFRGKELKDERTKMLKELKDLKVQYTKEAYAVDNTSLSVVSQSAKKSRYLRNNEGYWNSLNLLVAYNPYKKNGYAIFVSSSQITSKDLSILSKLSGITQFYTDNRHRTTMNLTKTYTQSIERLFSVIKRKIYTQVKDIQYWKGNILYTNMAQDTLINLYRIELENQHIKILN